MNALAAFEGLIRKRETKSTYEASRPLCEEYRPGSSADLALDPVLVEALRGYLGSEARRVHVTAHPGSGLTTCLRVLARELDLEAVWISSDEKSIEATLARVSATRTDVSGRRKIIVLDEADAIMANKRSKTAVVAYADKNPAIPIVVAGHPSRSAKSHEFSAKWPRVFFPRLGFEVILDNLLRIPGIKRDRATVVAVKSNGDLRAAFNVLEMDLRGTTKAKAPVTTKDRFMDGMDAIDLLLTKKAVTLEETLGLHAADPGMIPAGVHENYPAVLSRNDLGIAASVAEYVSCADLVHEHVYATQTWDAPIVHDLLGVLGTSAPALELRRRKSGTTVESSKFGSAWSKIHNLQAKKTQVQTINAARVEHGLTSLAPEDMALWAAMAVRDPAYAWPLTTAQARQLANLRMDKSRKMRSVL